MAYPDGYEDAIVEDERRHEIADAIDQELHPYRRCIEMIRDDAAVFRNALRELSSEAPSNEYRSGASRACEVAVSAIERAIDKYELRGELDLIDAD